MKFRAYMTASYDSADSASNLAASSDWQPLGSWQRRHGRAVGEAISGVRPFGRGAYVVMDERGRTRPITENQFERGLAEYDQSIRDRDARGVWG